MIIYLIRHGETTGDIENKYGGDYNDHLTIKGESQAKELSEKLFEKGIELIYHSPKFRAIETAKILNEKLNINLKVVGRLRERNNYGVLTGLTKSEAIEKFPIEVEKFNEQGVNHSVTNSEEYSKFKERVLNSFLKIASNENYSTLAIVTHGGPIKCLFTELFSFGKFKKIGDCGFIKIQAKDNEFILEDNFGLELE